MKNNIISGFIALSCLVLSSGQSFAHGTHFKDFSNANIERLHQGLKEVVITIDDGPTQGVTDKILDILEKYGVQATFFSVGNRAKQHPELMARMAREGHIVANHTLTHPHIGKIAQDVNFFTRRLKRSAKEKIRNEILGAHEVISPYLGNATRYYFRAPGASWDSKATELLNKTDISPNYYGPILWDVGGQLDKSASGFVRRAAGWGCWSRGWSVEECLQGFINETLEKKGGVVLFHDLSSKSAQLIERYIQALLSRGDYRIVSMDDVQLD
jgi:peptidoglycan/xylan/chitin deacetylase (PgdA/CDA1 family)